MDVKASSFDADNIMKEVNGLVHEPISDRFVEHILSQEACPMIDAKWHLKDYLWNVGVHLGINRDGYKVPPGLYRIGSPNRHSDVIVTANYKYTLDVVRRHLKKDYWLLIIDTDGVNVWCAAGKGKFGTAEVIYWIRASKLAEVVDHRRVILPQLAAPGVQAKLVQDKTQFHVKFGPVDIQDMDTYTNSYVKSQAMTTVNFPMWQRFKVTFVEWSKIIRLLVLLGLISFYEPMEPLFHMMVLAALTSNLVLPLILPIRPFRKFYLNGLLIQALLLIGYYVVVGVQVIGLGAGMISLAYSGYLAMNFTGSTTFTSLSGVKNEMEEAVPRLMILLMTGVILLILGLIGKVM